MNYKVLAFDIDGTLTDSNKNITERTKNAIIAAQKAGCIVVIASGRPKQGVMRYVRELELGNYGGYILALNGGLVERCSDGLILNNSVVDKKYYPEIISLAKENKVNIMTYDGDDVVSENVNDKYLEIESRINGLGTKKVDSLLTHLDYEVPKFLMLGDGDYLAEVEKKVYAQLNDRLDVYRSEPFFLEILPKNINKAKSLELLLNYVGATREELMSFGDGYNDISMIEYAGMGVAMGNAKEEVKKKADYITLSNEEDGIVAALDKFL